MAVTLKMLAERAGLSPSTVSQILNRKPNDLSSEETRKRVFELAAQMGYKQNFGHKVLRGDRTKTVAILIGMKRMSGEEHIKGLILGLLDKLEQQGYSSYLLTMQPDTAKNLEIIRDLCARGVESFIFIGEPVGRKELTREISDAGKTFIGYQSNFPRNIENYATQAGIALLKYFLEKKGDFKLLLKEKNVNSTRFKALQAVFPDKSSEELLKRYVVLMEHDDTIDIDQVAEAGYQTTRKILEETPDVPALLYLNDYYVLGGVRALMEKNKIPGKDVLVAGFNNIFAVRNSYLPISSTIHPLEEIAETIVRNLNGKEDFQKILFQKEIIRDFHHS